MYRQSEKNLLSSNTFSTCPDNMVNIQSRTAEIRRGKKEERKKKEEELDCGPMPNVMVALPNKGGAACSTPQFSWCRLLECRAVTLPRRETGWNYLGCPKLTKRSQQAEVHHLWGHVEEILLLNKFFFPIVDTCLSCEDIARLRLCDGAQMAIFGDFFWSCICSELCAAHFRPAF